MMFGMFLLWGVLIALAVWAVTRLFPRYRRSSGLDEQELGAQEILARRYARGEITGEEYESMKRDIGQGERNL